MNRTGSPHLVLLALACMVGAGCRGRAPPGRSRPAERARPAGATRPARAREGAREPRDYRVVHVFVALADNRSQGIVPVPAALGNGQDPAGNLYWGAMYGVKTFFRKSPHWIERPARPLRRGHVLDRAVFRSKALRRRVYVVADAYDGARMRSALADFFHAAAGRHLLRVPMPPPEVPALQAGGWADMVCFVGHNGLMDVRVEPLPQNAGPPNPACAVVLACKSRAYFLPPLRRAACKPLITTTGLMAPEAYTLDAVIRSWAAGQTPRQTRDAAAAAYARYQRCSLAAARRLFAPGG